MNNADRKASHFLEDKENIIKTGKSINLRLLGYQEKTGKNVRLEIQVWVNISDMTELVKEIDKRRLKMNKGKVNIVVDGFLLTNLRGRWESRAEYVFIRTIFDKILMKQESKDYAGMVKEDAAEMKNEINSFLNLNKFIL